MDTVTQTTRTHNHASGESENNPIFPKKKCFSQEVKRDFTYFFRNHKTKNNTNTFSPRDGVSFLWISHCSKSPPDDIIFMSAREFIFLFLLFCFSFLSKWWKKNWHEKKSLVASYNEERAEKNWILIWAFFWGVSESDVTEVLIECGILSIYF